MKSGPSQGQGQGPPGAVGAVSGGEHPLTVALRIRPMMREEIIKGSTLISHKVDENMVVLMDPLDDPDDVLRANRSREKQFLFDQAFDGSASQERVYEKTTRHLIESVINGYNATVFAYGATGAGKTHTMLGTDRDPGLMVRALNDLFKEMDNSSEDMTYKVTMSYLEIYNEMIRDLLDPSSGYLDMREDAKGVHVAGLSEISTKSTEEIMFLLKQGNKERTQEPTKANLTSSRSHAIMQVTVKQQDRAKQVNDQVRVGKLFLIDLAGSERASNTQNRGKRMVEGAHINRSLLALGNCINALSDKNGHKYVNFRDSKLTRLLKDGLVGNCRTVMIAHVSPASFHFEESRNTLVYAERAKNIKTKIRRNVLDVSYHVAQYTAIIEDLRHEINRLRKKVSEGEQQQKLAANIQQVQSEVMEAKMKEDEIEVNRLKEELISTYRAQLQLRKNILELKSQSMEMKMEVDRNQLLIKEWDRLRNASYRGLQSEPQEKGAMEAADAEENEPLEVQNAREELKVLASDSERNRNLVHKFEHELDTHQERISKIEEILPRRISSMEQKEIFKLLLRLNKMELENFELKVQILLRDHDIKTKTIKVERSQYHRSLCDDIIQQQRALLEDNNILIPKELDELYKLYQREVDMNSYVSRDSSVHNIASLATFNASLTTISRKFLDSNIESQSPIFETENVFTNEGQDRMLHTKNKLSDDDQQKLLEEPLESQNSSSTFKSSFMPVKADEITVKIGSRTVSSFSQLDDLNRYKYEENLEKISENESQTSKHSARRGGLTPSRSPHLPAGERKTEIMSNTRNIAALATRKRADVLDRLSLFDANLNKTFVSLHSIHENGASLSKTNDMNYLTPSRLATHDQKYGSLSSVRQGDMDNLSVSDRRSVRTDRTGQSRRGQGSKLKYRPVMGKRMGMSRRGHNGASNRTHRASEPLGEIKEPEHVESFHQLNTNTNAKKALSLIPSDYKPAIIKSKSMQRRFANRLPAATETAAPSTHSIRKNKLTSNGGVKFSINDHRGGHSNKIYELTPTPTPEKKIHQSNAEKGRGLTVQRKVKENSNISTPRNTDKKATPSITSYRKGDDSIAIMGFSLAR